MADRKQFLPVGSVDDGLQSLLTQAKNETITEKELHEQRVSFAFGNAMNLKDITKESVRKSSANIRL